MSIRVNRLHYPVTVLGPGVRAGIWVQGCSLGCRGCMSRDTWDEHEGSIVQIADIVAWLQSIPPDHLDGITISGGEPFDQPGALGELLAAIASWRGEQSFDILCYSGYTLTRLMRRHAPVLQVIDAIITGPYRIDKPTDLVWRGSANQELIPITPRGMHLYEPYVFARPPRPSLQVTVEEDAIRWIGVPRRGDLERLEQRLSAAGIELTGASWRP